jgi:hypothetical protein
VALISRKGVDVGGDRMRGGIPLWKVLWHWVLLIFFEDLDCEQIRD